MADVANPSPSTSRARNEPSTAELVQRATEQVSRLVRDELALARAELTEKGKHAGIGVGLFGGGGVLALYGLGALLTAVVLLLALVMPAWLAALIVAVALFAVAGVLALVGKKQVSQAVPPMPEAAVRSVRADVDTVTAAVRDRGRA
ncbi:phage holin family protein [Micromonospora sp. WMMD882]|uniref:phage holin family protein n=1 Tax=Micromonospora sp. WMMD882 TaxID=3015151 RepID=UPI00248B79B3|nr:phage holin family protein [Micromonospora sp. WMMD882]WBB81447.1 phage holin family protein [Micromonospora sp. WMMD882]